MRTEQQLMKRAIACSQKLIWGGASLLALLGPNLASANHSHEAIAYKNCRFDEDWSAVLDCAACDSSSCETFTGKLKQRKLSEKLTLSLGGQGRVRMESWDDFGFGPSNHDTFVLTRLRVHADLWYHNCVRLFAEAKSAFSSDRDLPGGRRTLDVDELALQNGFLELRTSGEWADNVYLRVGRQELAFGKQRLISPLDWANTRRTFDAVRGGIAKGAWSLDAFYSHPVYVKKYCGNRSSGRDVFTGAYASGPVGTPLRFDAYWLLRDRNSASYNGMSASECRHSLGGRIYGKFFDNRLDLDTEAAYQFGDFGSQSICAYMVTALMGYTFTDDGWKPRLFAGIDVASGDNAAGSGDQETFSQLFPLGHAYLGFIDIVGRQNILAYHGGLSVKPVKGLFLLGQFYAFCRMERGDALYNAGGGVVRSAFAGSKDVGCELDFLAKYKVNRHIVLLAGYSHFWAGRYIDQVSPAANSNIDFVYVSGQYTF